MKKVNTKRFQDKTPEDISFQGDSIPEKPVTTAKDFPLPVKETKTERTNVQPNERTNVRTKIMTPLLQQQQITTILFLQTFTLLKSQPSV